VRGKKAAERAVFPGGGVNLRQMRIWDEKGHVMNNIGSGRGRLISMDSLMSSLNKLNFLDYYNTHIVFHLPT